MFQLKVKTHKTEDVVAGRVETGVEGFDDLIEGGFPRGSLILLAGLTGSGKTIFSARYLYHGLETDEPGIYVSFAESRMAFMKNMKKLNMDFERYEQKGKFKFLDLMTVKKGFIESVISSILEEIGSLKAKRLVIDSFSALAQAFPEKIDTRIVLHTIIGKVTHASGVTSIVISEIPIGSSALGAGMEEFVADGVMTLSQSSEKGQMVRRLQVIKMRGTETDTKQLRYEIGKNGIKVYSALKFKLIDKPYTQRAKTGIVGLDEMLEGGVYTVTLH